MRLLISLRVAVCWVYISSSGLSLDLLILTEAIVELLSLCTSSGIAASETYSPAEAAEILFEF